VEEKERKEFFSRRDQRKISSPTQGESTHKGSLSSVSRRCPSATKRDYTMGTGKVHWGKEVNFNQVIKERKNRPPHITLKEEYPEAASSQPFPPRGAEKSPFRPKHSRETPKKGYCSGNIEYVHSTRSADWGQPPTRIKGTIYRQREEAQ